MVNVLDAETIHLSRKAFFLSTQKLYIYLLSSSRIPAGEAFSSGADPALGRGGLEPRYRRSDHRAPPKPPLQICTYSSLEGEARDERL
jgi:hypothetical protein